MSKARDASFRQIVAGAFGDVSDNFSTSDELIDKVALRILERLRVAGYALHDTRWCVRIRPQDRVELGRPMTDAERMAFSNSLE